MGGAGGGVAKGGHCGFPFSWRVRLKAKPSHVFLEVHGASRVRISWTSWLLARPAGVGSLLIGISLGLFPVPLVGHNMT